MRVLFETDQKDYREEYPRYVRCAVRSVIMRGAEIAMVYSDKKGYFKFPGGGVKRGETYMNALIRETAEETGLNIIPSSVAEFGLVREKRRSVRNDYEVFEQFSYYYTTKVREDISEPKLERYERELGYRLKFIAPEYARSENLRIYNKCGEAYILREAKVLEIIIKQGSELL